MYDSAPISFARDQVVFNVTKRAMVDDFLEYVKKTGIVSPSGYIAPLFPGKQIAVVASQCSVSHFPLLPGARFRFVWRFCYANQQWEVPADCVEVRDRLDGVADVNTAVVIQPDAIYWEVPTDSPLKVWTLDPKYLHGYRVIAKRMPHANLDIWLFTVNGRVFAIEGKFVKVSAYQGDIPA